MEIFHQSAVNTALVLLALCHFVALLLMEGEEHVAGYHGAGENGEHMQGCGCVPDEKGDLKISIALENLLYIESADNYTTIYYLNKSEAITFSASQLLEMDGGEPDKRYTPCALSPLLYCQHGEGKDPQRRRAGLCWSWMLRIRPSSRIEAYYDSFMHKFSQYTV